MREKLVYLFGCKTERGEAGLHHGFRTNKRSAVRVDDLDSARLCSNPRFDLIKKTGGEQLKLKLASRDVIGGNGWRRGIFPV